jgi:hypothetical protein
MTWVALRSEARMGILARSLNHRVHVKYLRNNDSTTRFKDRGLFGGPVKPTARIVVTRESYLWGTGGNFRFTPVWSVLTMGGHIEPNQWSMLTSGRILWFTTE